MPLAWERRLSAAFILGDDYGTRASTVVLVDDSGLWFEERRFGPGGRAEGRSACWLARAPHRSPAMQAFVTSKGGP